MTADELDRGTYHLREQRGVLGEGRPDQARPPVVVDIGGNLGLTSLAISSLYPAAQVYTYELNPGTVS